MKLFTFSQMEIYFVTPSEIKKKMKLEHQPELITAAALSTHGQKPDYQTWMQSNQNQDFLVLVYDFVKNVWSLATSE